MTSLWPLGVVNRNIHFLKAFTEKREMVFQVYEQTGGEYYGNESSATEEEGESADNAEAEESSESGADTDAVFSNSFCLAT